MMKFSKIQYSDDSNAWYLSLRWERAGEKINVWSFVDCQPVVAPSPPLAYVRHQGVKSNFNLAGPEDVPIVTSRLAQLLERHAPQDVQRIPVDVEGVGGDWEIIKVRTCLDAIDHSKSWIVYNPIPYTTNPSKAGTPKTVYKLVLDPRKVGDANVFRLKDWSGAIFLSEPIRLALMSASIGNAIRFEQVPTDSHSPGQMKIQRKGKLVNWSVEERNKWLEQGRSG